MVPVFQIAILTECLLHDNFVEQNLVIHVGTFLLVTRPLMLMNDAAYEIKV